PDEDRACRAIRRCDPMMFVRKQQQVATHGNLVQGHPTQVAWTFDADALDMPLRERGGVEREQVLENGGGQGKDLEAGGQHGGLLSGAPILRPGRTRGWPFPDFGVRPGQPAARSRRQRSNAAMASSTVTRTITPSNSRSEARRVGKESRARQSTTRRLDAIRRL